MKRVLELKKSLNQTDESIESSGESFGKRSGKVIGISGGFDSADKQLKSYGYKHPVLSEDTTNGLDAKNKEEYNAETGEYLEIEQPENFTENEDLENSFVSEGAVSFIETEKGEEIIFENELPESEEPEY